DERPGRFFALLYPRQRRQLQEQRVEVAQPINAQVLLEQSLAQAFRDIPPPVLLCGPHGHRWDGTAISMRPPLFYLAIAQATSSISIALTPPRRDSIIRFPPVPEPVLRIRAASDKAMHPITPSRISRRAANHQHVVRRSPFPHRLPDPWSSSVLR